MRNLFASCICASSRLWPWGFQVPFWGSYIGCASCILSQNTVEEGKPQTWYLAFSPCFIWKMHAADSRSSSQLRKYWGQLKHFFPSSWSVLKTKVTQKKSSSSYKLLSKTYFNIERFLPRCNVAPECTLGDSLQRTALRAPKRDSKIQTWAFRVVKIAVCRWKSHQTIVHRPDTTKQIAALFCANWTGRALQTSSSLKCSLFIQHIFGEFVILPKEGSQTLFWHCRIYPDIFKNCMGPRITQNIYLQGSIFSSQITSLWNKYCPTVLRVLF